MTVEERAGEKIYAGVNVPTPTGNKRASEGAVVLENIDGEFFITTQADFNSRYKKIESEEK